MHRGTWDIPKILYKFCIQDFHFLWCTIPDTSTIHKEPILESRNPAPIFLRIWGSLGYSAFARRY